MFHRMPGLLTPFCTEVTRASLLILHTTHQNTDHCLTDNTVTSLCSPLTLEVENTFPTVLTLVSPRTTDKAQLLHRTQDSSL